MKFTQGYKMRVLRLLRDLSQREVAEQVGIAPTYLTKLEKDERTVSHKHKENIANFFGTDILTIFDDEDPQLFIDFVIDTMREMHQKETQT